MKNKIIILGSTLSLASCGSQNRIGDLTTIGNRNIEGSKDCWSKKKFTKYTVKPGVNKWTFN